MNKLNVDSVTKEEFLSRPTLQDSVMISNIMLNEQILSKWIQKYDNSIVDGVQVTRAGILAAAQFGPGKVIEFFDRTGKFSLYDGNGVSVMHYMSLFANHKLPKHIKL